MMTVIKDLQPNTYYPHVGPACGGLCDDAPDQPGRLEEGVGGAIHNYLSHPQPNQTH